jgi:hypothetical protein
MLEDLRVRQKWLSSFSPDYYLKGNTNVLPFLLNNWLTFLCIQTSIVSSYTGNNTKLLLENARKLLGKYNPNSPLYTRFQNNFTADLKLLPSYSSPKSNVTCLARKLTNHCLPSSFCFVFSSSQQWSVPIVNLTEKDKASMPNEASRKKRVSPWKCTSVSKYFPRNRY